MHLKTHFSFSILLAISLTILFYFTLTSALDEPGYGYNEESADGPKHWGDLEREWAACKGDMQSPIDLSNERVTLIPNLGRLTSYYKPQYATVSNRGHDVAVTWKGDAGSININGNEYFLQQSHWHWPSEHTINGRRYDLELHMVHASPQPDGTNKTAVVGILYKYGLPDPFLSELVKYIVEVPDEDEETSIGVIDPSKIFKDSNMYYRYMGSLTVPPCTEGISWTINTKIRTVSRGQVKLLKNSVLKNYAKKNARPVQILNHREIGVYDSVMAENIPHY